jgi:altronate dehydratase
MLYNSRGGWTMTNTLVINPMDTVGVALADLPVGARLEPSVQRSEDVITREPIPFGHKVALVLIRTGEHVIKYGASIGIADGDIEPGHHVHVHNVKSVRGAAR